MTDTTPNLDEHAGFVVFPRNRDDLLSTQLCPACHARLASTLCDTCELDLDHPAAGELATTSAQAAALLDRRLEIIGQMRADAAAALAEQAAAQAAALKEQYFAAAMAEAAVVRETVVAPPVAEPVAVPQPVEQEPAPRVPPRSTQPSSAPASREGRRSSIQVLLLIVGISLLSVAAVFFLVYAFINYGLIWRSAIIASITVAAFVAASLLRRRDYTGTAEGIAVFAVVLVYLDAFAVKANNLFGLGNASDLVFWGTTLIISSGLFVLWHRRTALRVGSVAGFATFAPGIGLLVAGLSDALHPSTSLWATATAVGLAGLVHPLAVVRATDLPAVVLRSERVIALSFASLGLLGSLVLGVFVEPDSWWAPALALGLTALVALAHVAVVLAARTESRPLDVFAIAIAALGGLAAAAAVAATASRQPITAYEIVAPVIGAAVVTAVFDVVLHRRPLTRARPAVRSARLAALIVSGVALTVPVFHAVLLSGEVATRALVDNWSWRPTDVFSHPTEAQLSSVIALCAVTALAVGASRASGVLQRRATALRWPALLTVLAAIPLLSVLWLLVAVWFAVAGAALALIVRAVRSTASGGARPAQLAPLAMVATTAGLLGYLSAWASVSTWPLAALAAVALLLSARLAVRRGRSALLAAAIAVIFVSSVAAASYFDLSRTVDMGVVVFDTLRLLGIAATAVAGVAAIPAIRVLSNRDRRTMFWMAVPVAFACAAVTWAMLAEKQQALLPEPVGSLVASAALLGALALWALARTSASVRDERALASLILSAVAFWLVDSLTSTIGLAHFGAEMSGATAVLVVSAAALLGAGLGRPVGTPLAREVGTAIIALATLVGAIARPTDATWLVLIVTGVAVLLLAISSDGLFNSRSPRRYLGWLALVLGTAGLWWRLVGEHIADVEAYVLPLAGGMLLISLLVWRAARRSIERSESRSAPYIALAGLLIAILPLSVNAVAGEPGKAVLLFAISSVALLAGSLAITGPALRPYLDALAVAGASGTITLLVGRSAMTDPAFTTGLEMDGWLAAGLVVLLVAAFGQSLKPPTDDGGLRRLSAEALGLIAIGTVLVAEMRALAVGEYATPRAWAALALFCLVYLGAALIKRAPLTRALGVASLVSATVTAIGAVTTGALQPVEIAIVAGALAALAAVPRVPFALRDRRLLFWLTTPVALLIIMIGWSGGPAAAAAISDHLLSGAAATILVVALVLWAALQNHSERIAASAAIAPAFYLMVDSIARPLGIPDQAVQLAPISSALLVAAGALALELLRPETVPRWALEMGILAVALPATVLAVITDTDSAWLVLLLAGATALISAIGAGGLFRSLSDRRHLAWLALALATAGLWWQLTVNHVAAVEPYVLPLSGALLLIAVLVWNSERRIGARGGNAAPLIALGGLLVAIVPMALTAATGELLRAVVVGLCSAALALVGSLIRGSARLRPFLDVAALAGVIGVLVLAVGRALHAIPARGSVDLTLDYWLAAAVAVLMVAAYGQSAVQAGEGALRVRISQALGMISLTLVLGFEITSFDRDGVGQMRAIVVVVLFSVVHVIGLAVDRAPLGRLTAWTAFGFAAIAAIAGTLEGALRAIEVASVPLAIALLATGAIHLRRTPTARSWPSLGPGMLLLLVPSVMATFEAAPLWRLVAIGIVAVAAIVVGLVRHLQAPFIVGVVIALVHGFRTFLPHLQSAYQATEWWVWAGIGGLVLVVLAARYEKSVRTLRTTITRIGELR